MTDNANSDERSLARLMMVERDAKTQIEPSHRDAAKEEKLTLVEGQESDSHSESNSHMEMQSRVQRPFFTHEIGPKFNKSASPSHITIVPASSADNSYESNE